MKKKYNPIGEITSLSLSSILTNMIAFYFFHQIFHAPLIYTFGFIGICILIFFYVFIKGVCEDRIKLFGTIYPGIVSKEKSKNIVTRLKQIWITLLIFFSLTFFTIDWVINGIVQTAGEIISLIFTLFMLILSVNFGCFVLNKYVENTIDTIRELEKE